MARPQPDQDNVTRTIVETLMGRVLDGTYPHGSRLPSERDLAAELGVARVSVRQALGVLGGWRVVGTVRGSGATVSPDHAWTSDVLPAVMAFALASGQWATLGRLVTDALELRRSLVLDMLERAAPHLEMGSLGAARRALARAAASTDRAAFLAADREIIPLVLHAAAMLPSVWLLSSLAAPYLTVMSRFGERAEQDPLYERAHLETFAALEARDGATARARFSRHLDVADRLLVDALPDPLRTQLSPKKRRSR